MSEDEFELVSIGNGEATWHVDDFKFASNNETTWFGIDQDGYIGVFGNNEQGAVPECYNEILGKPEHKQYLCSEPSINYSLGDEILTTKLKESVIAQTDLLLTATEGHALCVINDRLDYEGINNDPHHAEALPYLHLNPKTLAPNPLVEILKPDDLDSYWFNLVSLKQGVTPENIECQGVLLNSTQGNIWLLDRDLDGWDAQELLQKGKLLRAWLLPNEQLLAMFGCYYYHPIGGYYNYAYPFKKYYVPPKALHIDQLPLPLKKLVGSIQFSSISFAKTPLIQSAEFFDCSCNRVAKWLDLEGKLHAFED